MSFDLFVLVKNKDIAPVQEWLACLERVGIGCKLPSEFRFELNQEHGGIIECRLQPPLVEEPTEYGDYEFELESSPVDSDTRAEYLESTDNDTIKEQLKQVDAEFQLSCSGAAEDEAYIVSCYMAAALAEAYGGLLFDPQQFGAVSGEEMYKVAKAYST